MTLSINCKDAGDPACMVKLKKSYCKMPREHGVQVHGFTEETGNEDIAKNKDHFSKFLKNYVI
jgi:hypothetical protein